MSLKNDTGDGRKKKVSKSRKKSIRNKERVESYKYAKTRKNLPTDQTSRTMHSDDARPIGYLPDTKKPRPPILQWDRELLKDASAGPLYIHEKLHPSAFAESLKKNSIANLDMFFANYDGLPKDAEFEWYQHAGHWQNRIIRGESRHVMTSLLAKEGMAGKVQMIYFDPPYGINFKNIFQANINRANDAGKIPNDPVAVQTFRDSYKNGIHSYLDSIYQIAIHARELLADEGSFFVQIGSDNMARVHMLLDEVFGAENRMAIIPFVKIGASSTKGLPDVTDYILWYAKDISKIKYHQLYEPIITKKDILDLMSSYAMVELKDGNVRNLTSDEKNDPDSLPNGAKLFQRVRLDSMGHSKTRSESYEWDGKIWKCFKGRHWSVSYEGLYRLADMGRLIGIHDTLWRKQYEDEYPGRKRSNMWAKMEHARDLHYVVETAPSTIEKCILMSTDPGDLVYDPTCGSGTTAYVAERWGRRWITSDFGLVAINLARQRILASVFPWHILIDSEDGIRRENEWRKKSNQPLLVEKTKYEEDPLEGFVCERIPHVSTQFLAYPDRKTPIDYFVDKPETDQSRIRVSSPFTIESLSPYRYVNPDSVSTKHTPVRDNIEAALRDVGIRFGKNNVPLSDLVEYEGRIITHLATLNGERACVLVANDDCTVSPVMVDHAVEEASAMPNVSTLILVAFAYEATIRAEKRGRLKIHRTMANNDLQQGTLKDGKNDTAFVLIGEPDIAIKKEKDNISAEIIGYDTYDPGKGHVIPGVGNDVYCWMIDTEYDGRSFFARRIHFPGAKEDKQIKSFYKKMQKYIDRNLWDSTMSLKSAPFSIPKSGRIAVKIITSTHMEMQTVIDITKHRLQTNPKNPSLSLEKKLEKNNKNYEK